MRHGSPSNPHRQQKCYRRVPAETVSTMGIHSLSVSLWIEKPRRCGKNKDSDSTRWDRRWDTTSVYLSGRLALLDVGNRALVINLILSDTRGDRGERMCLHASQPEEGHRETSKSRLSAASR